MEPVRHLIINLAKDRTLLVIHGLLLLEVALAILIFGGPSAAADYLGPHSHQIIGIAGVIPGLALLAGVVGTQHRRAWILKVLGLTGVVLWELGASITFALAIFDSPNPVLAFRADPSPIPGHPYVPMVYLNVALLALVHLVTLLRLGPPED